MCSQKMLEKLAVRNIREDLKEKDANQVSKDEWILGFRIGQCPHKESTLD